MISAFGVEHVSKGLPSVIRHADGYSVMAGEAFTPTARRYLHARASRHDAGKSARKYMARLSPDHQQTARSLDYKSPIPDVGEPGRTPKGRVPKRPFTVMAPHKTQMDFRSAASWISSGKYHKEDPRIGTRALESKQNAFSSRKAKFKVLP